MCGISSDEGFILNGPRNNLSLSNERLGEKNPGRNSLA